MADELSVKVLRQGEQVFAHLAHRDGAPRMTLKHHSSSLEIDNQPKFFNDGSSHQHRSLALDDEGMCKTHHTVHKDGDLGNPMASG